MEVAMEGREARGGEEKVGVRLFGVTICQKGGAEEAEGGGGTAGLEKDVMRKSKSMGNLPSAAAESGAGERGYLSDGGLRKCRRRRRRAGAAGHDRKKGTPWTEEEHRTFLEGLEKLGKGDWRGIARKFVLTRTPTQVASHAQKYFIRQTTPSNKKRRSSLFDVVMNDASTSETVPMVSLNNAQAGSKEINLLNQDDKKVGAPELNAGLASSLGPEIPPPHLHFMMKLVDIYEPRSFNHMEEASDFIEDKPWSVEPKVSQTLSLMLGAPQSAFSSKMHANQATFPREFRPFPCRPVQANTRHQVAEGNDLELSIAPPKPHSLSKVPPQNGVGVIRVV